MGLRGAFLPHDQPGFPLQYSVPEPETNLYHSEEKKGQTLSEDGKTFSYRAAVMLTKLKRTDNCADEMEDLFRKMFAPEPKARMSFINIRYHPIFAECFPVIEYHSKVLYSQQFRSTSPTS